MNILNEPTQGLIVPTKICYTYQFNNRTFSTQNTKISARSLAISYICFQVRIVKKKKKWGGGGKAILSATTENLVTPAPPDPQQGLYTRNCNGRNYTSYHWRPSWRPLFAENSRASGGWGSAPWAPGRGFAPAPRQWPYGGPLDPTRMRRAVRYAHGFFRPPLFCKSWIRHCTHPPLLVQVACPKGRRSWGSWGAVAPPPQWKYWGGGQTYRLPPPQ